VLQRDWLMPDRAEWLAMLARELATCAAPPVLVAHSRLRARRASGEGRGGGGIKAALLVAPADVESWRSRWRRCRASRRCARPLPFPSVVVASSDDPYVTPGRAAAFARAWGRAAS